MLEQLGDLGGHRELAVSQGIRNYFNILLPTSMTTAVGIGLILAVHVPSFSMIGRAIQRQQDGKHLHKVHEKCAQRTLHLKTISKFNILQIVLCSKENESEPQNSLSGTQLFKKSVSFFMMEIDCTQHWRKHSFGSSLNKDIQLSE